MLLDRHNYRVDHVRLVHLRQSMGSLREQSDCAVDGDELSQLVSATAGGHDLRPRVQHIDWRQFHMAVSAKKPFELYIVIQKKIIAL